MGLAGVVGVALAASLCLGGCSSVGYYWQSAVGHLNILQQARPVSEWVNGGEARERLRAKLALSQRIRDHATGELGLVPAPVYVVWARGSDDGTYFIGSTNGIFLLGAPADDDGDKKTALLMARFFFVPALLTR